ncbi:MAG: hypothetical protein KDH96_09920 [Candidatus Riesia sp.]|nr:hypothetical protein [Candidatus Riesia sp.]MCB9220991.1 hypothetical protein [Ignavibacteria bacterium]
MHKNILILTFFITLLINKVDILYSSEFIQDAFKINDVFLLPSLNTSNPDLIKFNYFNKDLFVINNQYNFIEDSISFILYKSESNELFKEYRLTFPKDGFSSRMHICDIYVFRNKIFFLEYRNLIEFEKLNDKIIFKKNYRLQNSCSEILSINSNNVRLTLNYITSDVFKDKEINFIYRIDLKNDTHSRLNFNNSENFKLINVGPRTNKVFIDDSTSIFSDIINFKFNIETNEGLKIISFSKTNWKSDLDAIKRIKVNYKKQKNTFSDLVDYNFENSSIYSLFRIDNTILVKYIINHNSDNEYYYDLIRYNKKDNSLAIIQQYLKNYDLSSLNDFGVDKLNIGRLIKVRDNYLLDLVRFPFPNGIVFKNKDEYLDKTKEKVINDGLRYSVIIRELK